MGAFVLSVAVCLPLATALQFALCCFNICLQPCCIITATLSLYCRPSIYHGLHAALRLQLAHYELLIFATIRLTSHDLYKDTH